MDKKLLPYFENVNDGGEQRKYLKKFGNILNHLKNIHLNIL